jgi:hypothetical protein
LIITAPVKMYVHKIMLLVIGRVFHVNHRGRIAIDSPRISTG